jgi:hypothetical protein
MKIAEATEADFQKATIKIYHNTQQDSHLHVSVLK